MQRNTRKLDPSIKLVYNITCVCYNVTGSNMIVDGRGIVMAGVSSSRPKRSPPLRFLEVGTRRRAKSCVNLIPDTNSTLSTFDYK